MISAKTLFLIVGVSIIVIIAIAFIVNKRKNSVSSSSSKSKPKAKSKPKPEKSFANANNGPSSSQTAGLAVAGGAFGIIGYLLFTRTGNILLLAVAGLFVVFILFIWYFWANMANGFSKIAGGIGSGMSGLIGGLAGSGSSGKKTLNKNSYRYRWLKYRSAKHMKDGSYRVYNRGRWETWWYDTSTGKWSVLKGLPSWESYETTIAPDGTKTYTDSNTGEELLVITPAQQEYDAEWYAKLKQREIAPVEDTLDDAYLF